jgi:hypothetical protein
MDAPPGRVRLAVDLLKHLSRTPAQGDETNALPIQFRQLLISGQLRVENQFGREFAGMLFPEPDKLQNLVRLLVFGDSFESTNFYATNVDLVSIPPEFIHQLGRSRWTIDVTAFQTITTDCHLKQPSVHQDVALIVLTMIRVLAYTLTMVFYHRQVRSHCRKARPSFCEAARSLALALLSDSPDTS